MKGDLDMGLFRRRRATTGTDELADEMTAVAMRFAAAYDGDGLDFGRESLVRLDEILDGVHRSGAQSADDVAMGAACYVFEVARREFGGRFLAFDEQNPVVLVVGEPEFRVGLCAIGKTRGRITLGAEDHIPFFYEGFVQAVAARRDATIV
ncbi:MAG: hypothetical protein QM809_17910 [Gordonia sp. (in: high G+C Gram-positive bacteria)]|uniref:hypothetical protein n=1 Tax=Gordonia sp. (in: high G+C Gram-positive bacteria) TaxID=84139 RepID=UPI0039E2B038